MKTLAIDPGKKRVGLAACDELGITTRPLPVLESLKPQVLVEALVFLIESEGFERVIIGNPLNMDGSPSKGSEKSKNLLGRLKAALNKKSWPGFLELYDERLTSFEAKDRLKQKGIKGYQAKEFLDSVAALVLLEDYLQNK